MRTLFLLFVLMHILYRLFHRHCWVRFRRHHPFWIPSHDPRMQMRVCEACARPIFPFVRRAR